MDMLFDPTDEDRRLVRAMAGFGVPQDQIALHLEFDAKTLRKHYRRELDQGSIEATTKVAQSLFQMATQGKNVAAAIFWMKARAGWSEKQEININTRKIEDLTDAELGRVIQYIEDQIEFEAEAKEAPNQEGC